MNHETTDFARWTRAPRSTPSVSDAYAVHGFKAQRNRIGEYVELKVITVFVAGFVLGFLVRKG